MIYNLFRTYRFNLWQENVVLSQIFTNSSVMAQGYYSRKFSLRSPVVVRSYLVSPAVEPIERVVTLESSLVKSRLEGDQWFPFVSLLIMLV